MRTGQRLRAADVPCAFYFGRTPGSPPGLPGGGITGMLPTSGVGALMPGSTFGGHSTPSLWASLLLKVVPLPVVAFGVRGDCGVGVSGILRWDSAPGAQALGSRGDAPLGWACAAPPTSINAAVAIARWDFMRASRW